MVTLTIITILFNLHKPVDGPEKRNVLVGGVDGGQDDQHEDEGGAGDARGGDGGGRRGQAKII